MRLYAFAGQRAAALRQYQLCVGTLADELGVIPSRETEVLRERIRSGEFKKDGSPLVVSAARKPTAPSLKFTPDPLAPYSDRPLLVARDKEVAQLDGFLQQTLDGKGRVVFITGEAGEGKTTLMQEFARQAQQKAPELIVAGGNCDAFVGRGDSYLPFREVLVRLSTGQAPGWRQVTVQTIQALINKAPDLVGLFVPGSTLLRQARILTAAETDWLPQLKDLVDLRESQQGLRDVKQVNLFQQYAGVMQALAQTRPLLLVLDDLHWADDGSLDLLFYLGRQLAEQPILIVGTYRPAVVSLGRHSSGSDQPQRHPLEPVINEFQRTFGANQIDLQQAAGQALVADLVDSEPNRLGPEFRAALYDHTQGHALFTVEVLREMQARGELVQDEAGCWVEGAPMHWTQLPARVEGVISERIGRLAPDSREILNVASVMGEEFTAELIARVLQVEERLVIRQLAGILDRQHHLVRNIGNQRVGRQRLSQFRFEHILFQNYLYQNLSQSERGYLHEDIGLALEHLYAGRTEAVTVQLAYHFREAGVAGKAVIYFILAGEGAMRMSAYSEAAQHFNRALPFLAELPKSAERRQQEFTVQFNLGKVWEAINGIGSQEAGVAYSRTLALARQLGESRKTILVLLPLTQSAQFRSEFEMAQTYGEECRRLAQELQDPELLMLANQALQMIALGLGQHDKAVTYSAQVIAFYRSRLSSLTFDDIYKLVFTLGISGLSLVPAGYPDRALQKVQEGLTLAQEREHHFGTASRFGACSRRP